MATFQDWWGVHICSNGEFYLGLGLSQWESSHISPTKSAVKTIVKWLAWVMHVIPLLLLKTTESPLGITPVIPLQTILHQ